MPAPTVLTAAQLAALRTFFQNDASMAALRSAVGTASEDRTAIAAAFNAQSGDANPWVFRTRVSKHEVTNEASADGTTFSYTAYINRSVAERDGWREVWNTSLTCDPTLPNVRQAFADIFSGAGGAAMRAHLLAVSRRKASVAELLLAGNTPGGAGANGSTGNPKTLGWEGSIVVDPDVAAIVA